LNITISVCMELSGCGDTAICHHRSGMHLPASV
jgi:hypothetical protein